jgi:hypothetical protein
VNVCTACPWSDSGNDRSPFSAGCRVGGRERSGRDPTLTAPALPCSRRGAESAMNAGARCAKADSGFPTPAGRRSVGSEADSGKRGRPRAGQGGGRDRVGLGGYDARAAAAAFPRVRHAARRPAARALGRLLPLAPSPECQAPVQSCARGVPIGHHWASSTLAAP